MATFTVTDTTAESVTYTATDTTDSVVLNGTGQTPTVTFTPAVPRPANSTVTAAPTSAEADGVGPVAVTVTLRDGVRRGSWPGSRSPWPRGRATR